STHVSSNALVRSDTSRLVFAISTLSLDNMTRPTNALDSLCGQARSWLPFARGRGGPAWRLPSRREDLRANAPRVHRRWACSSLPGNGEVDTRGDDDLPRGTESRTERGDAARWSRLRYW